MPGTASAANFAIKEKIEMGTASRRRMDKKTMTVRMKVGAYAGRVRELDADAAEELISLGRAEPVEDPGSPAPDAGIAQKVEPGSPKRLLTRR